MKIGPRGCLVNAGGEVVQSPAIGDSRVDTTGAGDAFAAGFLFAVLHNEPHTECARIANLLAGNIVAVDGCNYDALDTSRFVSSVQQTGDLV
jgi:sugar/nucleoside kinase (ribokinase family)